MSESSEIDRILSSADKLRYLGQNRAFLTLLFAIWANRKRGWLSQVLRVVLVIVGGGYGYWFFS